MGQQQHQVRARRRSPGKVCLPQAAQTGVTSQTNPGPYRPLYVGGAHVRPHVGGGQRTALCQGGVLAARWSPASLGSYGPVRLEENFSTPGMWDRSRPQRSLAKVNPLSRYFVLVYGYKILIKMHRRTPMKTSTLSPPDRLA